jgi:SagB-type dehydrogenase family enzyme
MKRSFAQRLFACCAVLVLAPALSFTQDLKPVVLPPPQTEIGRPLMQALKDRHSTRSFRPQKLPAQVMSNLLWAAFGINRAESGKRTAPSAMNWQETDIYVATADGLYLYDAKANELKPVLAEDLRAQTGTQAYVRDAPVNLVYVANLAKTGKASADRDMFVAADTGVIAQNVYLFCASEGLAVVVRGSINREELAKAMKLGPDQRIILAQTVGYPKK